MSNIRFIKSVYPGDELYTLVKVTELMEKRNETKASQWNEANLSARGNYSNT
ncbi:hypothetical protein C1A50_2623 [Paenibacillus polymyxa]|nr:hypothetical protein C1A50_2623 [Paenibacillus polymyxa]